MNEPVLRRKPPRGLQRWLWRMPIGLYRLGLGGLLGERFLLLEHTGRRSGQLRRVVVEVIHHDLQNDVYYAISGFGERSDWLRNLAKTPRATIQVGQRRLAVQARRLPPEEGELVMLDYARQHPAALRELIHLLDYQVEDNEAGHRLLGRSLPIVAFTPLD